MQEFAEKGGSENRSNAIHAEQELREGVIEGFRALTNAAVLASGGV